MDNNTQTTSNYIASTTVPGNGLAAVGTVGSTTTTTSSTTTTESSSTGPRKRGFFGLPKQAVLAIALVGLLLVGGIAAFMLTQMNQDTRNQASVVCAAVSFGGCNDKAVGTYCEDGDPKFQGSCQVRDGSTSNSCSCMQLGGGTGGGGESDNESGGGDDDGIPAGGNGQACRASGLLCDEGLFCNTDTGKCQPQVPGNLCQGDDNGGSGNENSPGDGRRCIMFNCGNGCGGPTCVQNPSGEGDCDALVQQLGPEDCGQVDYVDTNGNYCGVKLLRCDGSCSGGGGGGGGSNPVACNEITFKIGTPQNAGSNQDARVPKIGEQIFFKCKTVANAVNYKFRYFYTKRKEADGLTNKLPIKIKTWKNEAGKKTNKSEAITIDRVGRYYGQCSACIPDPSDPRGVKCSNWESVANSGIVISNTASGVVSQDSAIPDQVIDATAPLLRPYRDFFPTMRGEVTVPSSEVERSETGGVVAPSTSSTSTTTTTTTTETTVQPELIEQ